MPDEEVVVESTQTPDEPEGADTEPANQPDLQKEIEKWRAIARKHEERAKANAEAAARLKEIEDAGKSETEKLQAALQEAEKAARENRIRALKLEIAAEKGLSKRSEEHTSELQSRPHLVCRLLLEKKKKKKKQTKTP